MQSQSTNANGRCRVRVQVKVYGVEPRVAEAAVSALKPDDRTAPPWLRIEERIRGDTLEIEVSVEDEACRRLGTLRNTVDEILEFLYGLLKTLEETAKTLKEASKNPAQDSG